jgi:hypothetical protein
MGILMFPADNFVIKTYTTRTLKLINVQVQCRGDDGFPDLPEPLDKPDAWE